MTPNPIEFIAPRTWQGVVDGRTVRVEPLRVGQYGAVLRHANALVNELAAAPPTVQLALISGAEPSPGDLMLMYAWAVDLLSRQHDAVLTLVTTGIYTPDDEVALREPDEEWVPRLLPDRFIALLLKVVEINADFFCQAQSLLSCLFASAELPWNRKSAAQAGGPAPANSSSPTATGTPTS